MSFQYDFMGGSTPENTRFLKCPRCIDGLRYQNRLIIIPPDPQPIMNARPEPYVLDETNYLATVTTATTTQSASQYVTTGGSNYITSIPNPSDVPAAYFAATLIYHSGQTANLYLDLFNGDPTSLTNPGVSVLAAITGSATRSNISSLMITANSLVFNPLALLITSASLATINVNFVGFYDAATAGNLLTSGRCSIVAPSTMSSVYSGYAVGFATTLLTINIS